MRLILALRRLALARLAYRDLCLADAYARRSADRYEASGIFGLPRAASGVPVVRRGRWSRPMGPRPRGR